MGVKLLINVHLQKTPAIANLENVLLSNLLKTGKSYFHYLSTHIREKETLYIISSYHMFGKYLVLWKEDIRIT